MAARPSSNQLSGLDVAVNNKNWRIYRGPGREDILSSIESVISKWDVEDNKLMMLGAWCIEMQSCYWKQTITCLVNGVLINIAAMLVQ